MVSIELFLEDTFWLEPWYTSRLCFETEELWLPESSCRLSVYCFMSGFVIFSASDAENNGCTFQMIKTNDDEHYYLILNQ